MSSQDTAPVDDLERIIQSAARIGVEMDAAEAQEWLSALSAQGDEENDIVHDARRGVFGHAVTMLDFSPDDLVYFRKIGRIVEFLDEPQVETALALSGSTAQSKIQTYPGDCDYFERVNIKADTREEACQILARLMREKAISAEKGATYQFMELRFGSYPQDAIVGDKTMKAGASISWGIEEIRRGKIAATDLDGNPITIRWDEMAMDPGWCKLDWIIADSQRGRLANASNMLDVTWEAPDGAITPLDGYLDAYFQEVYLDAESIPIFSKLSQHVSSDALNHYVGQLENEVRKYVSKEPSNYGKAAKRMYNIFRLTGRFHEAAFLRELFDEPTTMLYQVWALIRTIEEALLPGSEIAPQTIKQQADQLILSVVEALEGEEEQEIVRLLLRLNNALVHHEQDRQRWVAEVTAARDAVINIVNNFFYEKLTAVPTIKAYIEELQHKS